MRSGPEPFDSDDVQALARAQQEEMRGLGRRVPETGDLQPEARGLYRTSGYERISCYPPYDSRALSLCFEKRLPPLE